MEDEDYKTTQRTIELISSAVSEMPLEDFIERATKGLDLGQYVNANLHAEAKPRTELMIESARALLKLRRMLAKARANGVIK